MGNFRLACTAVIIKLPESHVIAELPERNLCHDTVCALCQGTTGWAKPRERFLFFCRFLLPCLRGEKQVSYYILGTSLLMLASNKNIPVKKIDNHKTCENMAQTERIFSLRFCISRNYFVVCWTRAAALRRLPGMNNRVTHCASHNYCVMFAAHRPDRIKNIGASRALVKQLYHLTSGK